MPEPTPEEIEDYERSSHAPEMVSADGSVPTADLPPRSPALLWATGRDVVRPPAKALRVPLTEKGRNAQEIRRSTSWAGGLVDDLARQVLRRRRAGVVRRGWALVRT
jgi:hypothetical protein